MIAEQLELPFPEPLPPVKPSALTAFLVVVNPDGSAVAYSDTATVPTFERAANLADMRRACMEITADIAASQSADNLMARMAEAQRANAAQQQAERIRANLDLRKTP